MVKKVLVGFGAVVLIVLGVFMPPVMMTMGTFFAGIGAVLAALVLLD